MNNTNLTRAFIAIEFPNDVVKEIIRVQEEVLKVKFKGKLAEPENLHLTLKFLGEIDSGKLEEVKRILKDIQFNKMELKLGGIGVFNIRGNPRIVWIKVNGEGIWELQKQIDEKLRDLFKMEERFMGHLTLARVKYVDDLKNFNERIKKIGVEEVKFEVKEFKLKKSVLQALGPVYTDLEIYCCKE
jgi:2'-5' RNA ligase